MDFRFEILFFVSDLIWNDFCMYAWVLFLFLIQIYFPSNFVPLNMFKQKGKALKSTWNDQKLEVNSGRKSFWNNIFIITISNLVITVLFWISNRFQIVGIDLWTCFFFSLFVCWVPLQELFIPINLAVLEPNGFDFFVRDKIIPFMYRKYLSVLLRHVFN